VLYDKAKEILMDESNVQVCRVHADVCNEVVVRIVMLLNGPPMGANTKWTTGCYWWCSRMQMCATKLSCFSCLVAQL